MSERLTKRQLKHDRFLELMQEGMSYARDHAFVVAGAVIVFIAAVTLAVRVAGTAVGPRADNPDAQRALAAARTEFAMGRMDAGREALDQVTKSYGSSRAGREATYILANAYYESGDWAKASEAFEAFLRKPLYNDLLMDGAKLGIAACKEESGDLQGAYDAYKALWEGGHHLATRLDAAMAAARCAQGLGHPQDARTLYQAVVDAYPDAPTATEAKFALEGMGASS